MVGIGVGLINAVIWGGIFGVTGLGLLFYGWSINRRPNTSRSDWPSVKGKVLSVQVSRTQAAGMGGYGRVSFVPVIDYSYQVDGVLYQANNVSSGTAAGYNSVNAQKIADRYPAGKDITVRYNPSNPRESILDISPANGNFYMMAGCGALVIGAILVCMIMGFSIFTTGGISNFIGNSAP